MIFSMLFANLSCFSHISGSGILTNPMLMLYYPSYAMLNQWSINILRPMSRTKL